MKEIMYKTRNLPNTRIEVADALRGIAVAGIILYHSVEHFNIFTQEPVVYPLSCDQTVADVLAWLLSGKIYNLLILLMIVSAVVSAWYAFEMVRKVLHHLCIFGRMSLTNYLLQSIIGSAIFCGYGLGCYHLLGTTYAVMVGVVMVIIQYSFCRYWFSSHQRGPLEGLWRKLTWI